MPASDVDVELVIPASTPAEQVSPSMASPVPSTSPPAPAPPADTALPRTGSDLALALLVAVLLLVLGVLLVRIGHVARSPLRRTS